jgi:hypothetical protein
MTEPTTNGAGADIEQIVHALERARDRLQAHADDLRNQRDYSSEFASEDAQRMREAIEAPERPPGAKEGAARARRGWR